jgi:hypothetical protein
LLLRNDASVYSFGLNAEGQLGQGDTTQRNSPALISSLNGTIQIASGLTHCLVLLKTGQVYSFGRNTEGQLGLGDILQKNSPLLISSLSGRAIQIAAGQYHSLVLMNNTNVYSFGLNGVRQIYRNSRMGNLD